MNLHSNSIRSFFLDGPAGRLEAILNPGAPAARYAALVCHPHPVFGGTLHNKVVFHAMKAINHFGIPVLRFNFRSAGRSQGEHDNGRGEVEDVLAALDWLDREFQLPVVLAGFSFGAAVGLRAACPEPRVTALIGLGLPVAPIEGRSYSFRFLDDCPKPKLFVSGSQDIFGPAPLLEHTIESSAGPKTLVRIENADHFFAGKLHELRDVIQDWIPKTLVA